MQKKKAEKVDIGDVPEVLEFVDAEEAIELFKQQHADVFKTFAALTERYNTALEQADKVCRARGISSGPFNLFQFTTKYDAEALYNAVGRDRFFELGGKIDTVPQYSIDKGRLEAAIAQQKLDSETVSRVRKETPNFHKPEKIILP